MNRYYHLSLLVVVLVITLCGYAPAYLNAQDAEMPADLRLGPEYRNTSGTMVSEVIGTYQEHTILLKLRRNVLQPSQPARPVFERYTMNMELDREVELTLQFRGNDLEFERAVMQDGHIHVIASFHNRRTRKTHLFHRAYTADVLRAAGNWKLLGDVPSLSRNDKGVFKTEYARDSSFMLIVSDIPRRSGQSYKAKMILLDRNYDLVWERETDLGFPAGNFSAEHVRISRGGDVYLLGRNYLSRRRSLSARGTPYNYALFKISDEASRPQSIAIPGTDKFVADLTFQINRPDEIVFAGFYSETSASNQKGTVYFRYDPVSNRFTTPVFTPFSIGVLEQLLTRRQIARGRELLNFDLNQIILRNDGGGVLIAEQYHYSARTEYAPYGFSPMYRRYYGYHPYRSTGRHIEQFEFNEILVTNIGPEGDIQWAQIVPKRQTSVGDEGYYSSYTLAVLPEMLVFLYNDNIMNYSDHSRASAFGITGTRRSVVTMAMVTHDGALIRYPILNSRDEGILTRPSISRQVDIDRVIIYGEWGNRYRLGNLFIL